MGVPRPRVDGPMTQASKLVSASISLRNLPQQAMLRVKMAVMGFRLTGEREERKGGRL